MLNLAAPTRDDWIDEALSDLDTVLLDHAHCEKKAASTALGLIFYYQDQPWLMRPLSELAREELEHFEQMLGILDDRDIAFGPLEPSPYAGRLRKACRGEQPLKLVDTLLCCALIEARSCERMKILSERLDDPELAAFYASLLASEARHHTLYVDLAGHVLCRDEIRQRLKELAAREAEILASPADMVRMHT